MLCGECLAGLKLKPKHSVRVANEQTVLQYLMGPGLWTEAEILFMASWMRMEPHQIWA